MRDFTTQLKEAVLRDGLQELTVRVSRYGPDMKTPEAWQAIAKYRERAAGPWGVGIRATPEAAIEAALAEGLKPKSPIPEYASKPKPTPTPEDLFG